MKKKNEKSSRYRSNSSNGWFFTGLGAVTAQAADDDITIGVSIWSSTDVLGSQSKKIIDKAADALGVNVMYVDQGHVI
mgnify:CR=1 FL=1